MKKFLCMASLSLIALTMSTNAFAKENKPVPIFATVEKEDIVSVYQINTNVDITRAEFIIAIIKTTDSELFPVMDTHYAMPYMKRAEEFGLISLDDYPVEIWSDIMPTQEKMEVLSKCMQSENVDMGKVYTSLSQLLIENVSLNDKMIDLNGLTLKHYKGKLMLPIRVIAETMGFKVEWNPQDYSCTLNNDVIKSTVQIGFDSYNYSSVKAIGMSSPFSAGAAPLLIDGTFYVPVDYFSMFADVEVTDNTVFLTIR